jgi:predicted aldo/keto reductase-like oxidoreductase
MKTHRKQVVLAMKVMPDEALDDGLRKLNTDFVEIVIPPIDDIPTLRSEKVRANFEAARAAGKCAHMGFACHTQKAEIIDTAVEMGYFDVILMSYADTSNPEFMASLERARAAGVAIMAMKGLPKRAEGAEALEKRDLYASLCTSMLSNSAHTVLASMGSHQIAEMYRDILDKRLGYVAPSLERRYWAEQQGSYCAMCGNCRGICPNGVEVAEIVRFRMYDQDYRMHDYARAEYASLGGSCSGANCWECGLCESVCSRSLPLRAMIAEAHGTLA